MPAPAFSLPASSTCFAVVPDVAGLLAFIFLCGGTFVQEIKILIESHHTSASLLLAPCPMQEPELVGHCDEFAVMNSPKWFSAASQAALPGCRELHPSQPQVQDHPGQGCLLSYEKHHTGLAVGEVCGVSLGSRPGSGWGLEASCCPFVAFWCVGSWKFSLPLLSSRFWSVKE